MTDYRSNFSERGILKSVDKLPAVAKYQQSPYFGGSREEECNKE